MSPDSNAASGATAGIGVLSSLFAGLGQHQEGKQQEAAFDYNASVAEINAGQEMVATEQRYSQLVGRQATAYAASGVDITRGSPLLMMAATAGRGGRQQAQEFERGSEEATLQRYYGKLAAFRGTMSGIGTFLKGISSSAQDYLKATGYQGGGNQRNNIPTDTLPGMNPDYSKS